MKPKQFKLGQAFRALKESSLLDNVVVIGYLAYKESDTVYRGEDGQTFAASLVEGNTKWWWPVTKRTIKKLRLDKK